MEIYLPKTGPCDLYYDDDKWVIIPKLPQSIKDLVITGVEIYFDEIFKEDFSYYMNLEHRYDNSESIVREYCQEVLEEVKLIFGPRMNPLLTTFINDMNHRLEKLKDSLKPSND